MNYVSKSVKYFLDFMEKGPLWAGMFFFCAMAIIVFAGVVMRYLVDSPITWEAEITAFLMAWGVFMGTATVTRDNSHIRITFFAERIFGKRGPEAWTFLENIMGIGLCGYIAYLAGRWLKLSYITGAASLGDVRYDLWIPRMAIAIGLVLMTLFYSERLVKQLYRWFVVLRGGGVEKEEKVHNILEGL